MNGCDEDGFSADSVHVYTRPSLEVVQVDVAKLCDEVDDVILAAHLSERGSRDISGGGGGGGPWKG